MTGRETETVLPLVEPLTRRERQVLALLAEGYSGPEMSEKLTVALSSVKFHIQNIYGKLGANSKRQAITRAGELGLLGTVAPAAVAAAQFGPAEPAEALPEPGESPFKGLRNFEEADAALFFGREALVARLAARLAAQAAAPPARRPAQFLAVVGASGSGKSSLVRAGLIPALRAAAAGAPSFAPIHVLTPTAHPLEALAITLTREAESLTAATTLMDDLARDSRALHLHLRRLSYARDVPRLGGARSDSQVLLVVDQFEELFTLCRGESERQAFIDNLLRASAPEAEGPASVLITLRADFYSACAPYTGLRDVLASQQEYIGPMSAAELRQAVELPARLGRWAFAPGLVDQILRDAGEEPGTLPLLSHALLETWRNRRGRTLTLESYAEAGRVQGAIATTAETVFQSLEPDEQALARGVFLRLTELGEGTQDTRRRVPLAELLPPGAADSAAGDAMAQVLKALSDARLITTDDAEVQVAHEALIREWPTLRGWLTEDREGLRLHRRLTEAAQEWALLERDPSELWRGPRLIQALDLAQARPADLNPLEAEFVEASRVFTEREAAEREAQRQNELAAARGLAEAQSQRAEAEAHRAAEQAQAARRLRGRNRVISLIGILALVAALAAGFFGIQSNRNAAIAQAAGTQAIAQRDEAQHQAQLALANQLAAQAVSVIDKNISLAMLLGAEAIRVNNTFQARSSMAIIFRASPHLLAILRGHGDLVSDAIFSPDGKRLVTSGQDGTLRQWDVATHQPIEPAILTTGMTPLALAISPDGATLAVGGQRGQAGSIRLFDLASGQPLPTAFSGQAGGVTSLAFSPDGKILASGSTDKTIRLWDVASGQPRGPVLTGHAGRVTGVAFSPDGKLLASSSFDKTVRLWSVDSGQAAGEPLVGHLDGVTSVAFSPDGRHLATGGRDQDIFLWDLASAVRAPVARLRGHTAAVTQVAFSPDGTRLVSASADWTLLLWNVAAGVKIGEPLAAHLAGVTSVAFSPNGKYLVSGSADHTVILWQTSDSLIDTAGQDWVPHACAIAGRNLTLDEWNQYLTGQPYRKTCEQLP